MSRKLQFILALIALASSAAFRPLQQACVRKANGARSMTAVFGTHDPLSIATFNLAVEVTTKPDDYVYGAVNAPPVVPILAAIAVIALAGVPFLLRPGEEALEAQRENEREKGNAFGSGDAVGKRNKKL